MRLPGGIRVTPTLRRWRSRFRRGVAILGYHRVSDTQPDSLGLSVSPANFREQLEVIARIAQCLSLDEAARSLAARQVPRRGLVLTFDDGYVDNLHVVLPLLQAFAMPVTIFVTAGNRGGEFWWDRLARALSGRVASSETYRIAEELQCLPEPERQRRLQELEDENPRPPPAVHRSMDAAELQRISSSPLVEIGAHGTSHAPLTMLPPDRQRQELIQGREELERVIGRPVLSFAYPHGALSPDTVRIVGETGYTVGCCSKSDVANGASDPLALPRLWVRNLDGTRFERWLRGWLHG